MIDDKKVLAIITARGGSKGLPRKNILPLCGKPLIAWSIEAGAASTLVDRTVVSTDDDEIAETARSYGGDVPFMRPAELADDNASVEGALLHVLDHIGEPYEMVVLLQATSPLRTGADIDACIRACVEHDAESSVTVCPSPKSPYLSYSIAPGTDLLEPLLPLPEGVNRRQEMPPSYTLNGAVYVSRVDRLRRVGRMVDAHTVARVMPAERSADIDTALDLAFAQTVTSLSEPKMDDKPE